MRRVRRLSLIVLVWVTAVPLALGNVPYIVCHCPDGSVKLFCAGTSPKTKSCCERQPKPAKTPCCTESQDQVLPCCREHPPTSTDEVSSDAASPDESAPVLSKTSCQRSLLQAMTVQLTRDAADVAKALTGIDFSHDLLAYSEAPASVAIKPSPANSHHPPSHPDLCILLSRITI